MNNACRITKATKVTRLPDSAHLVLDKQYLVEMIQSPIEMQQKQKAGLEHKNMCTCNAQSMIQIIIAPCSHL